tara:strand:+ start:1659 stop:2597 length:939 start_codon:yes stop_codon:yes gene_type:complete
MGTLKNFYGEDEETISKSFKSAVASTLADGGVFILGAPIGPELPNMDLVSAQSEAIGQVHDLGIFSKAYGQTILAIDKALPPGIIAPPVFDPTFVIDIQPFFDFLLELGVLDPGAWFTENYPKLLGISLEALEGLSKCENEMYAEEIVKIDSSLNVDDVMKAAEKICKFTMPSFAFPIFSFEIPDFGLPELLPIEMFAIPNINIPQINWAINFTLLEIIGLINEILSKIEDLITALLQGIVEFILYIVNFIVEALFAALRPILQMMLDSILFVANLITFIGKVIAAFIVALVGHIIGDGVVTVVVAEKLGLV